MKLLGIWLFCVAVAATYVWALLAHRTSGMPWWLRVGASVLALAGLLIWSRETWCEIRRSWRRHR